MSLYDQIGYFVGAILGAKSAAAAYEIWYGDHYGESEH